MLFLCSLHTALFLIAPFLSTSVWKLGPISIMLGMPLAIIAYGIRDVAQERWRELVANQFVFSALIVRALCWPILFLAGYHEAFRIALAGELQLFLSQYIVAPRLFAIARRYTSFAWTYNIVQIISSTIALFVFVTASNLGTTRPILSVILGGLLLRWIFAILLTPFFTRFILVLTTIVALYIVPIPTQALEVGPLKFDGIIRVLSADVPSYPVRLEAIPTLRLGPVFANELLTWDHGSALRKPNNIINSKLTIGLTFYKSFSFVIQRQDISYQITAHRIGIEWKIP